MFRRDYVRPFLQTKVADNILNEIFSITKQLKIKTFLVFGTCLGFVRDGGYIQGDWDVDIGVICKWKDKDTLKNALEMNDFILKRIKPKKKHLVYRKGKLLIDIWFQKSENFYSNFDNIDYKGRKYHVPHPVEEYLSVCYSNWKVKEDQKTRYLR